jgi:mycofactocin precursor
MEHDTTVDTETDLATGTANDADLASDSGAELVDDLLIEEISIDGMCGVY